MIRSISNVIQMAEFTNTEPTSSSKADVLSVQLRCNWCGNNGTYGLGGKISLYLVDWLGLETTEWKGWNTKQLFRSQPLNKEWTAFPIKVEFKVPFGCHYLGNQWKLCKQWTKSH